MRVAIIDLGTNNFSSLLRCFNDRPNIKAIVTSDPKEISNSDKIILPGIGNFKFAIKKLIQDNNIECIINHVTNKKRDILGICLGMQLLSEFSCEGNEDGLKLLDGKIAKLKNNPLTLPHYGWNSVNKKNNSILLQNITNETNFYFCHSYYMDIKNEALKMGITTYNIEFPSVIEKENIFGVQFHPEKSYEAGEILINNFLSN